MDFKKRCKLIKQYFGSQMDIFFDAGPGGVNQESHEISLIMKDISIYGFEASIPRYDAMKDTYPGEIINVMLGDSKKVFTGYLGGAKLCKVPIDNFRINITKEEEKDQIIGFKKSTINCITLDDFYKDKNLTGKIFIWADIEGAELSMLKGAIRLLETKKIIGLNLELSNKDRFPKYTEIINFLNTYQYKPIESCDISYNRHKDVLFKLS